MIYEQTALPGFAEIRVDEKNSKGGTAERLNDYDGFTQKFEAKKATDDCYTPPLVYDAIAGWVAAEYGVSRDDFIRPFYPGNDYTAFDYTGKIVVDNPPFSTLGQIVSYYDEHNVKFFLWCPLLTSMKHSIKNCCYICCDSRITYENGAKVNTAYLTNLEPHEIQIRTAPDLRRIADEANRQSKKEKARPELPKYKYPPEVVSIQLISAFARHDIDVKIRRDELYPIIVLDSQRAHGKAIFGAGFLTSHSRGGKRTKHGGKRTKHGGKRTKHGGKRTKHGGKCGSCRRVSWLLSTNWRNDNDMICEFTIPGKPCGKGRPRFYNGRAITPEKTMNYETLVKLAFRQAYPSAEPIAAKVEVIAKITAYYPIPVSASKKLQARMRAGQMKPTTKPDTDNIAKICLDALNDIAYHDDAQIVELQVTKLYSDEPRVVVWLAIVEA